jgi:hypothetical protein
MGHSKSHRGPPPPTRTDQQRALTRPSELDEEVYNSIEFLQTNGFTRSDIFFAYPDGGYNSNIIAEVKAAGYVMAKYGTGDSLRQPNLYGDAQLVDPYNLTYTIKATDITNTSTVNVIESKINDAIAQKSLLILTFHEIFNNTSNVKRNISSYELNNFTIIANYIAQQKAAGNIMVTNFSSYYALINANQIVNGTSISVSPTSNTYYYYMVNDTVGTTAYSPTALIKVSNAVTTNSTSTTTSSTTSTSTTTTPQNNNQGGGGGGGGGGGSGQPTVTQVGSCSAISNFTTPDTEYIWINNVRFEVTDNFIGPTTAGVTINGTSYTLSPNVEQDLTKSGTYTITLSNISYIPVQHTITVTLCLTSPTSGASTSNSTTSTSNAPATTTTNTITPSPTTTVSSSGPVQNSTNTGSGGTAAPTSSITPPSSNGTMYLYLAGGIIIVVALIGALSFYRTGRFRGSRKFKRGKR